MVNTLWVKCSFHCKMWIAHYPQLWLPSSAKEGRRVSCISPSCLLAAFRELSWNQTGESLIRLCPIHPKPDSGEGLWFWRHRVPQQEVLDMQEKSQEGSVGVPRTPFPLSSCHFAWIMACVGRMSPWFLQKRKPPPWGNLAKITPG